MVFEPGLSTEKFSEATASPLASCCSQVQIKNEDDRLLLVLPSEAETNLDLPWSEVWQELKHLLQGREQSWQLETEVCLVASDRLIDNRQLQSVEQTLKEVDLKLTSVSTSRRQTAVAAATAGYSVEQNKQTNLALFDSSRSDEGSSTELLAEPLYLQHTIRSGVEIRHSGTIIICGDLNPGGAVIAAGDIFVWGRLRGVAHAGARGNCRSRIMALQMEFTQLRIADTVARSPQNLPQNFEPEVAFVNDRGINLARAHDFAKIYYFSASEKSWIRKNK